MQMQASSMLERQQEVLEHWVLQKAAAPSPVTGDTSCALIYWSHKKGDDEVGRRKEVEGSTIRLSQPNGCPSSSKGGGTEEQEPTAFNPLNSGTLSHSICRLEAASASWWHQYIAGVTWSNAVGRLFVTVIVSGSFLSDTAV